MRYAGIDVLKPVDFFDSPEVFDAAITNIPSSVGTPVQVVASLGRTISRLRILDGVGKFIGVYQGALGAETLVCIIDGGFGNQEIDVNLPVNSRISLRSMTSETITSGNLCVQFLGVF